MTAQASRVMAIEPKRAVLTARLAEVQRERHDAETVADELPQLLRAILLARRDRDAGMSPRLRERRAYLERVLADAEELLVALAEISVMTFARNLNEADPVVREARVAFQAGQEAVAELGRALRRGSA